MESKFHEGFYSFAKYYDIAFDFKNVSQECNFLESVFTKHSSCQLTSFIEFGAGPALHCMEMARTLSKVTAVDLSQEMITYAEEKARSLGLSVRCELGDMINSSTELYDLATLLMDSTSYLLTNADVIAHLRSVSKVLNSNGIYILEMSHPKSVFEITQSTVNDWEMKKDDITVKIQWGKEGDKFDPITQQTEVSG
jgi:2-polyprenyl-3-methyl-5-hydroxy-6-metoxy-1,4-benzoquinol methylase